MTELEVLKNVVRRLEGAAIDYLVLSKLAWAKPTMSEFNCATYGRSLQQGLTWNIFAAGRRSFQFPACWKSN